jgi:hypothetical protein
MTAPMRVWMTRSQKVSTSRAPRPEAMTAPWARVRPMSRRGPAGSRVTSASTNMSQSPVARCWARCRAWGLPSQPSGGSAPPTTTRRGSVCASRARISPVPSVERSSTTTTCRGPGQSTARAARTHFSMLRASLRAGTTMDSDVPSGTGSGVMPGSSVHCGGRSVPRSSLISVDNQPSWRSPTPIQESQLKRLLQATIRGIIATVGHGGDSPGRCDPQKDNRWETIGENKGMVLTGRILTAVCGLGLLASAAMKIMGPEDFVKQWAGFGFAADLALTVGIIEIVCALLYLIPQTALLGTLLVVAYMGGATATHLRIGDPFIIPVLFGVVAVGGLFLRDARLRALLPLRR